MLKEIVVTKKARFKGQFVMSYDAQLASNGLEIILVRLHPDPLLDLDLFFRENELIQLLIDIIQVGKLTRHNSRVPSILSLVQRLGDLQYSPIRL